MEQVILSVNNLSYSIPTGSHILSDISFSLVKGEFLGVLGKNGVGKTTLMDLLMGFRNHIRGEIIVFGDSPVNLHRRNYRRVSFLSQEVYLKKNISIRNFLDFHASFQSNYQEAEELRLLEYFNLSEDQKMGALSTGQQKKVQIIANLASTPELILIDEITAVLDPETRMQFFKLLEEYKLKHNVAIVMATNIAEDLIVRADKILFIDEGEGSVHDPSEINNLFNLEGIK